MASHTGSPNSRKRNVVFLWLLCHSPSGAGYADIRLFLPLYGRQLTWEGAGGAEHASLLLGKHFSPCILGSHHPSHPPTPFVSHIPTLSGPAKCRQGNMSAITPCQLRKCCLIISQRGTAGADLFLHLDPHFYKKADAEA